MGRFPFLLRWHALLYLGRLRAAPGIEVIAAEWHTVTSPKLGKVSALYHMLFGYEYAEGKPLDLGIALSVSNMLIQELLHTHSPPGTCVSMSQILEDARPLGSFHHPSASAAGMQDEAALRFLIGAYTDSITDHWNQFFNDNGVDVLIGPIQYADPWTWSEVAENRIALEVLSADGTYSTVKGSHTAASNSPLLYGLKSMAIPKVAVPLGLGPRGRPVACCLYGRAVPPEKRYDSAFIEEFDLDFLYQAHRIIQILHAHGSSLCRAEPRGTSEGTH